MRDGEKGGKENYALVRCLAVCNIGIAWVLDSGAAVYEKERAPVPHSL